MAWHGMIDSSLDTKRPFMQQHPTTQSVQNQFDPAVYVQRSSF